MRQLLHSAALSIAATLMLAPAAVAQGVAPGGGSGPYGCPTDAPFVATAPGDPGEASLMCFTTQEEADQYSQTGGTAAEPPATEIQYETPDPLQAPATTPALEEETQPLPDTGGPGFLLPAAAVLLATGLVGLRMSRRP